MAFQPFQLCGLHKFKSGNNNFMGKREEDWVLELRVTDIFACKLYFCTYYIGRVLHKAQILFKSSARLVARPHILFAVVRVQRRKPWRAGKNMFGLFILEQFLLMPYAFQT